MRESFVFYKSFYDAINLLGEKAQLKLYKSVMKLNFNCCENETEMLQLCDEIETELKQNRHTFAQFLLIKPQILANFNKYLAGCKGASKGCLGGAPKGNKNASKNNPKTTPNENEECRMNNVNVLNEAGVEKKEKKVDVFINPIKSFFIEEYKKVFSNKPYLSSFDLNRLIELNADNPNLNEILPIALNRLKNLKFDDINFTPSANWLLKGNNFERLMNGEFEKKKDNYDDWFEQERQKELKRNENSKRVSQESQLIF